MKKIPIIFSIFLIIISCGQKSGKSIDKVIEKGDLHAIRAKRIEIVNEQKTIADQIKQLDEAIASLDTIKKIPVSNNNYSKRYHL